MNLIGNEIEKKLLERMDGLEAKINRLEIRLAYQNKAAAHSYFKAHEMEVFEEHLG